MSVGELRVFGPQLQEGCGWETYGPDPGGAHVLALGSSTPPAMGLPVVLSCVGASSPGAGGLAYSLGEADLPLLGGTLLLDPTTLQVLALSFDASGKAALTLDLPVAPGLSGGALRLQAFALGPRGALELSNGLRVHACQP